MKVIGQVNEIYGEQYPPLKALIHTDIPQKDKVLQYMKNAKVAAAAPGIARDILTNDYISGSLKVYSDGEYAWRSDVIYYVEKYDMGLPEEFIDHILGSKGEITEARVKIAGKR